MRIWIQVGALSEIPVKGARVVKSAEGDIAVFRTADDRIFALYDRCPHKGGPLSQGLVHGASVTCPLHNWVISLESGEVQGPDEGCVGRIAVELRGAQVWLGVPSQKQVANG
jgi:nitrite reductase (NADH) small subunit